MPERKSKKIEEDKPTIALRRSPRLHRQNQAVLSPKTPKPAETRRRRPVSFSTSITKFKKTGHGVSVKETDSNSEKSRNGCRRSARTERRANFSSPDLERRQTRSSIGRCRLVKDSEKFGEGSRRYERRDRSANVGKSDQVVEGVIEKRVTRSSVRGNKAVIFEISDSDSEEDSGKSKVILSKERKAKVGVDYVKKNEGKFEKRVTRSSSKTYMKKASNVSNTSLGKDDISEEMEPKGNDELPKVDTSRKDVKDSGVMVGNEEQNCTRKAQIGMKRKRDGVEEQCKTAQGWTHDQESALQRAYFAAKPTPQFWKKVARMVPGKSPDECFDRIHSDHSTPPQPQTRLRAKRDAPSPLSFSASKLLSPVVMKSKRLGTKRRTLLAQKTVRQILQKQQKKDQDYSADLFAVLEPTVNTSPVVYEESASFVSPAPKKSSPCRPMPSSSQRNHLSRINIAQPTFASPPVLKQIKNKALHEKYIDQLHCREAKRKAAALKNSRNLKDQLDEDVNVLKQNVVKAAKDALVFDAQDAISKFRSLQSRIDEDGSTSCDEDDEVEDEDDDL